VCALQQVVQQVVQQQSFIHKQRLPSSSQGNDSL
jgi:hypothetical protein